MQQLINNVSILIFLVMMLIMAIAVAAFAIIYNIRKKAPVQNESADMEKRVRKNASEILPIEDIKDNMIIEKGGNRFSAVITCVGNDFYTKSLEEKVAIQNNYIDFIFALKEPITFRQYDEGINMDYTYKKLTDAYKSLEEQLFHKMEDFKEHQKTLKDMQRVNDPSLGEMLSFMEQEKASIESLQWRMDHIKEECAYLDRYSKGSLGTQKLTYVVSWSPSVETNIGNSAESIYETAKRELDQLCKIKIRQLSDTGAVARRCQTNELIDICRRHSSPISANRFTMQQIMESTYFDDVVTTDMTDRRNQKFEEETIRNLLSGGI